MFTMKKIDVSRKDIIETLQGKKPLPRGLTLTEIGKFAGGVSRQRIHQIASNPNWTGITGRPRKDG